MKLTEQKTYKLELTETELLNLYYWVDDCITPGAEENPTVIKLHEVLYQNFKRISK